MKGRARGFTLIELLIGLMLITMALTIAFAALRLGIRALERTDLLAGELEELRIARTVLQRHLTQARPLQEASSAPALNFRGELRLLEFVAPAPAQHERLAGLYHYRLRFDSSAADEQLLLDYQPYTPGPAYNWSGDHETTPLLSHIAAGQFSYYGAEPGRQEWLERWSDTARLPRMVRVTLVRGASRDEPLELVLMLPTERAR
ncbi:MAG TPA: prepilin-type N-terminal cleavage/methylation domain-containing protein [Gammaproteobacteria bacterium]